MKFRDGAILLPLTYPSLRAECPQDPVARPYNDSGSNWVAGMEMGCQLQMDT